MTGHDRYRELVAAHVLGALDAHDRTALEAHLEGCAACRAEVVALAALPGLLRRVDVEDVVDPGPPAEPGPVVAAALAAHRRLGRSRRRWRAAAGVAAAAAVVLGAVAVTGGGDDTERAQGVALAVEGAAASGDVELVAEARPWGTYLHVRADDLPPREAYVVWTVDRAGRWAQAGSWGPAEGAAYLGCSTSLVLSELERVVVTSADRDDVLLEAS